MPRLKPITKEKAEGIIEEIMAEAGYDNFGMELQEGQEEDVWAFWAKDEQGDPLPDTSYLHSDGSTELYGL